MAYGTGGVFKRRDTFWVHYSIDGRVVRESAQTTSREEALAFLARRRAELATTAARAQRPADAIVADLTGKVMARYTKKKRKSIGTAAGHEKRSEGTRLNSSHLGISY